MRQAIGFALIATIAVGVSLGAQGAGRGSGATSALPVVVFETTKGSFEMEMYPN